MDSRGVSPLIGFVLLFGIVAVISVALFFAAIPALDDTEQYAEQERVEQSMVELNSQLYSTALKKDSPSHIDLDLHEQGAVTREETGHITVAAEEQGVEIENTIGTIEWEGDDGATIASEGGAVFRETGNKTQLISAPPFEYDSESTTLTFPVINTYGEKVLKDGDIRISHENTTAYTQENVIENESLTVTVESDYCVGWEEYFINEVGPSAIQDDCSEDQTVVAEIGRLELSDAFDRGITYTDENGYSSGGNPDVTEERQEGQLPNIDDEVEEIVNSTKQDEDTTFLNKTSDTDLQNGLYYVDGIESTDQYEFDLTDGNATLVVEGNIVAGDDAITVSERSDNHVLRVYVTGTFTANGGNMVYYDEPTSQDASVIQMFGTNSMQIEFFDGFYEGVIYAPTTNDNWNQPRSCGNVQACFHSNPDFYGSLVIESVHVQGGQGSGGGGPGGGLGFVYDEDLEGVGFELYPNDGQYTPPPRLTYLNIVKYDMTVESGS